MEFYARMLPGGEEISLYPETSGEEAWLRVVFAYMRHLRMAKLEPISDLPSKDLLSGRKKKPKKPSPTPCEEMTDMPYEEMYDKPSESSEWPFRFMGRAAMRRAIARTGKMLFGIEVPFNPLDLRGTMDSDDELATLRATHRRMIGLLREPDPYIVTPAPTGFSLKLLTLLERAQDELAAERTAKKSNDTPEEL